MKPDFVFPKLKLAVFVDGCFWRGLGAIYRFVGFPSVNSVSQQQNLGLFRRFGGECFAYGVKPVDKQLSLGVGQAGLTVDEPVRGERHAALGDFVGTLFEFTAGAFRGELVELGEI